MRDIKRAQYVADPDLYLSSPLARKAAPQGPLEATGMMGAKSGTGGAIRVTRPMLMRVLGDGWRVTVAAISHHV
ncbi:MAG: hypothetical protein ACYCTF_09230, partial [Acidiferrobacter sp.]